MPTATLKFKLPEEKEDFQLASSADKLWSVIWELDQQVLRHAIKYNTELSDVQYGVYSSIRKKFWELLNKHDVEGLF